MAGRDQFNSIVTDIERRLSSFYGFTRKALACDHLVTFEELKSALELEKFTPVNRDDRESGVFLIPEKSNNDLFIGIYFSDEVIDTLSKQSPEESLTNANLDAFCVLVEELSHFHLLLNRINDQKATSHLELEWQGEVDKMLMAATILQEKEGDPHVVQLMRMIYDHALITDVHRRDLYWEATRFAAKFWLDQISLSRNLSRLIQSSDLRRLLKHLYEASWQQKLEVFSKQLERKAS